MDQLHNNDPGSFLRNILADPAADKTLYGDNLLQLVSDYPQSGILYALKAAVYHNDENLNQASVYFNAKLLFKLINNPVALANVPFKKIITGWPSALSEIATETLDPFLAPVNIPENVNIPPGQPVNEEKPGESEADGLKTGDSLENGLFIFGQSLNELKASIENLNASRSKPLDKDSGIIDQTSENLTRYHDETMPKTFLWWLNKTRKEHAGVYQPYAKQDTGFKYSLNREKIDIDELEHQYFENIFHITTVVDLEKSTADKAVAISADSKENQIIERFIKEEPQIKPQQSAKLDNENKAKKSSEDQDEIVTETLADIYAEQEVYHKAISYYKKLIVKFPEKSGYFAAKIEIIEKKINP